jgi:hypothetical protein
MLCYVSIPPGTANDWIAPSDLKSKLADSVVYTIPYVNGSLNSLEIRVNSITATSVPAGANISIKFGGKVMISLRITAK